MSRSHTSTATGAAPVSAPRPQPLQPALPTKPGQQVCWHVPAGSGRSLTVAIAAATHPGLTMVVTPDTPTAVQLETEVRFFDPSLQVLVFPDWETLPYDVFSPHQDIISQRLRTLYQLPGIETGLLVVPATTLAQRLAPRSWLESQCLVLARGDRLNLAKFRRRLEVGGYRAVSQVTEHGEYAVRGSLFDLFPMGSEAPLRVDLFDDEVDSLRSFDPDTQLTVGEIGHVDLLPAREFPLDEATIARFRQAFRTRFNVKPQNSPIYQDVSAGLAPGGIEYYLPLFFERTSTLFDYLPPASLIVAFEGIEESVAEFHRQAAERYEQRRYDVERPLLAPSELFLESDAMLAGLRARPFAECRPVSPLPDLSSSATSVAPSAPPNLQVKRRAERPLGALESFLQSFDGRVLIAAESPGRRELWLGTLREQGLRPALCDDWASFVAGSEPLSLTVAPLAHGLLLDKPHLAIVAESQLEPDRARQVRRRTAQRDIEAIVANLDDLEIGAPVVHEDHGVGRYAGLQILDTTGVRGEYLVLEYAGGDRLYVPVASLHLIRRYSGAALDTAPLHRLGSGQWEKAKRRAAEKACDAAAELLDIYARRAARPGHSFALDDEQYRLFAEGFPFEETPDQANAIEVTISDLTSGKPMDRVICGDVGFGKTEVAMRAAFVAAQGARQTAVLVPTTLLAQQHAQTFMDRFAEWPVTVEVLSRFRSRKEQDRVLRGLAEGTVDIVIGTHKLLQRGVVFKRLGLVVIDEEHRFGVRHKERLKSLRSEVDVLTLTATPIPRTLDMSLSGLRDLSVIATPPAERLAIKTFVSEWNDTLIHEACFRELKRGGQVYFLHNEVDTIERMARRLAEIVPQARLRVAHGQMRERQLEEVMLDFYHQRCNLLVCTTIIESGIDVPNANTIIIHRADKLGLAQLHQLRGRVGRSHHRAYAYLVTPHRRAMTADAVKRIEAIESMEDLGAGFVLATHDLEIRGAGELLGEEQSGQIQEVGFSLYNELLQRAVSALRSGHAVDLDKPMDLGSEIDLQAPALIPQDYVPDVHSRLILYKRVAGASTTDELEALQVEMIDRFGLLPEPAKVLFRLTDLKLHTRSIGILRIDAGHDGGRIIFGETPNIDLGRLLRMVQEEAQVYRLDGQNKLRFRAEMPDLDKRLSTVRALLEKLAA